MNRALIVVALLLSFGLTPARAQEQIKERPRERARTTLPTEVFQEIEALAERVAPDGIPGDPLYNKALEGMAKRVPANRLVPAVEMYANRLRQSRRAFGPGAGEALVVAGADALQRGVEPEALGRLGEAMRSGQGQGRGQGLSPMAVLVLADLKESGVSTERALGILQEAMRQRAREHEMLGLTGQVRQLMRQGQSPQDAAEQVRRALMRGRGGGMMTPPVPPGSEPSTSGRKMPRKGKGGGGG